jgi:hypothetical protein
VDLCRLDRYRSRYLLRHVQSDGVDLQRMETEICLMAAGRMEQLMNFVTILVVASLVATFYWAWPPAGIFVLTVFMMLGFFEERVK